MNNPACLSPPLPNENRDGLQREVPEHRNGTRHQKLTPHRRPMNVALFFSRILFLVLSSFFITTYVMSIPSESKTIAAFLGIGIGVLFSSVLFGFDILFRRANLRSFNIATIGLFVGYLMGEALVLILRTITDIGSWTIHLSPEVLEILKISLFLFGTYLGLVMTLRASDELYVSIPFVKFHPLAHKKKDLLLDGSVLSDARIIDLAASGIVDHHFILSKFVLKDLYMQAESSDEAVVGRAKRSLENLKKLENLLSLEIRSSDTDFPEIKDIMGKLIRLARLLDANILTTDINRVQIAAIEGVKIINLHALSNALKPLMQTGEKLKIKIQRFGKEPRQGVGYLDDGTMVVVNGGGDFIGETIDVYVLSVKHTASGRMIFCNTIEEIVPTPMLTNV